MEDDAGVAGAQGLARDELTMEAIQADDAGLDDAFLPAARSKDHVRTGLAGLDAQLGGGIPWGTTTLLLSNGTHAARLLFEHAVRAHLEDGRQVFYYGLDRPRREVLDRLGEPNGGALTYLDAYGNGLGLTKALNQKLGVPDDPIDPVQDLPRRLPKHKGEPYMVVIDSLTRLADRIGVERTGEFLSVVSASVRSTGGVAFALLEEGVHPESFQARARWLADGVIGFGVQRQGFGLYSHLTVSKMPGAPQMPLLLLCRETEQGLWLESTRRVF